MVEETDSSFAARLLLLGGVEALQAVAADKRGNVGLHGE
jgi:hypothetical protein